MFYNIDLENGMKDSLNEFSNLDLKLVKNRTGWEKT